MKEFPILFSGKMVEAILAGVKTQTRRIVKPQPPEKFQHALCDRFGRCAWGDTGSEYDDWWPDDDTLRCPYGTLGHRLWVKETHRISTTGAGYRLTYRADGAEKIIEPGVLEQRIFDDHKWRPSIFMPRWASRLTLEISAIRVERLADIIESDAIAEGLEPVEVEIGVVSAREQYSLLWDEINGQGSASQNPWVWVLEFRRIE